MNTSFNTETSSPNRNASSSIFSRLTAPFASKTRAFADFDINLDEPLREYKAGDAVRGSIQLAVPKPLRITHLVLSLHGFAKVYKNAAPPGDGTPSEVKTPTPGRGKAGVEYLGNGLVSLFEDEIVLAGEGKLSIGKYSFRFEAWFPNRSLPSSLSFERGTIQYALVATLTRPTTIAPTQSVDKKISFRETRDIATEPKPAPRRLHLKAIKRSRRRAQPKRTLTERTTDSTNTTPSSPDGSEHPSEAQPRSSVSDISGESAGIDSSLSMMLQPVQTPSKLTLNTESPFPPTTNPDAVISASVEVLRGGYLPGDYIPVRIFIKHTKAMKSMQGVIVTLYRKAKIDAYPVIAGSRGPAYEDPVPKSRTGLKGLSLSGRGSHLYRMDLAQTFAPMVINPMTLETEIKTAVMVPEDAFPTVASVPGQMIVFSYHVEIIMDLAGKLQNQDRLFSGLNMTSSSPAYSVGAKTSATGHGLPTSMEMYHLLDTSEIRRDKRIPRETFEIVIGSMDSKRKEGEKKRVDIWLEEDLVSNFSHGEEHTSEQNLIEPNSPRYAQSFDTIQPAQQISPPQLQLSEFQEPQDEKSRMQLAEQRLLPSAPPTDDSYTSSLRMDSYAIPSAPLLSDLETYNHTDHVTGAPDFEHLGPPVDEDIAPAYQRNTSVNFDESLSLAGPSTFVTPNEDKAELERNRLMAMASSPDDHDSEPSASLVAASVPSAPVLEGGDSLPYVDQHQQLHPPGYAPRL